MSLPVLLLAGAAALALGCGRTSPVWAGSGPCVYDEDCRAGERCIDGRCVVVELADAGGDALILKGFGEPCERGLECRSGYCLPGPVGSFCSMRCQKACPVGYECKLVPDPNGGAADLGLCAVLQSMLCQPCADDLECSPTGGDRCLWQGGGRYCARDCTFTACDEGYLCTGGGDGGTAERQCVPAAGACECTSETAGMTKGCQVTNEVGTCYGNQLCQPPVGWSACSAATPGMEVCNGIDDDCNGRIDDALPPRPCSRSAGVWTCEGTETCQGEDGWVCDAPVPTDEVCDYVDNNCDGQVDEGFTERGLYATVENCGGCGIDCRQLIPHVTEAACRIAPDDSGVSCRAVACETGYFPYADGLVCLALPANLCRACMRDEDCVAPGSRCIDLGHGEHVCGRDCGTGSPYPPCPGGYHCAAVGGALQCVPDAGTCVCSAANVGSMRACTVDTCGGFQTCLQQGGTYAWSACNVADYNPEICDGIDNNCDGRVDEGFLDPATGKYALPAHCGFCNNDCSKYWSPTLQHTSGVCDTAPPVPVCRMGPCTTEVEGGVTYEWVDVNGDPEDGCECRRVQGNTTVDLPDQGEYPTPGQPYIDENCDGVDGVIADALFVSAAAAAGGNGSIDHPYGTIGAALVAFPGSGKRYILVAAGTYRENVMLFPGVQLYGGYSADFRLRDIILHTSIIEGQPPSTSASGARAAVHAEGIVQTSPQTVLSGFTILGYDVATATPGDQDGAPSYAVYVKDSGPGLVLSDSDIIAGRGGIGGRGSTGARGYGRQDTSGLDGRNGLNSGRDYGACPALLFHAGGAGGVNAQCGGTNANPGGSVGCPVFNWNTSPYQGQQAPYTSTAGGNGLGGWDWSFDTLSGGSCSHATESGFPSNIQSHDGEDGRSGADAQHGAGAAGCSSRYGSLAGGLWVSAPAGAGAGGAGLNGTAGGGGGAGGGTARYTGGGCTSFEYGATGGGGGAGGCGGGGGRPGKAGGASVAVFVFFTSAPSAAQLPSVTANRIQRNFGGDGGDGGFGGMGGMGGLGGFGGNTTTWSGSIGGKGGDGGNGGSGGGGGGGCGGPSFGLLAYDVASGAWDVQNLFVTAPGAVMGGVGGAGGSSSGPAATGSPGLGGASANTLYLTPCAAGCPPGRTCDANGVCIPN